MVASNTGSIVPNLTSCFQSILSLFRIPMIESLPYDPPNWTLADSHGKAVRVGISRHRHWRRNQDTYEICPCCFKYIDKDPIPYS